MSIFSDSGRMLSSGFAAGAEVGEATKEGATLVKESLIEVRLMTVGSLRNSRIMMEAEQKEEMEEFEKEQRKKAAAKRKPAAKRKVATKQ